MICGTVRRWRRRTQSERPKLAAYDDWALSHLGAALAPVTPSSPAMLPLCTQYSSSIPRMYDYFLGGCFVYTH